jgi:hypothetical protein
VNRTVHGCPKKANMMFRVGSSAKLLPCCRLPQLLSVRTDIAPCLDLRNEIAYLGQSSRGRNKGKSFGYPKTRASVPWKPCYVANVAHAIVARGNTPNSDG